MRHQQTKELLPDQFRRLTAQYNLSTTQMRFQLVQRGLDFPPYAVWHRTHEEDRPLTASASGTDPQLLPRSKADFQRRCGRPESQSLSSNETIIRLSLI